MRDLVKEHLPTTVKNLAVREPLSIECSGAAVQLSNDLKTPQLSTRP